MKKNQKGRGPQNGLPPRALGPITTPLRPKLKARISMDLKYRYTKKKGEKQQIFHR